MAPCWGSVKMRSWSIENIVGGRYWASGYRRPPTVRPADRCRTRSRTLPPPFDALRDHVLAHSVKRGDFTLKSGAKSSWFLDTKQTACRPEGIVLVADAALSIIPDEATAIGGLTMGADPVAFGVAAIARHPGPRPAQLQRAQGGQGPRRHRPPRRRARSRATGSSSPRTPSPGARR